MEKKTLTPRQEARIMIRQILLNFYEPGWFTEGYEGLPERGEAVRRSFEQIMRLFAQGKRA